MLPSVKDTAVLLSCHGTISRPSDIPAFLTNIRRGRPAPEEIVREVTHRFEVIGGSPLMRHSEDQANGLSARLGVPVRVAGRLWEPYPKDVVADLFASGVRRLLSLPLAPQSVDVYNAVVREAARSFEGLALVEAPAWGSERALIDAFVETIDDALALIDFTSQPRAETAVVLTAHSLPKRVIAAGDPYEQQFREMAGLVARALEGRGHPVLVAFQSQGMTGDEWLGPDLPSTFRSLVERGISGAVVAPIGFVAEHVETLYDLDVEAPKIAKDAGLARFSRARAVNARPRFIDALEAVARRALAPHG
jgi:ferrochelatase